MSLAMDCGRVHDSECHGSCILGSVKWDVDWAPSVQWVDGTVSIGSSYIGRESSYLW